MTTGFIRKTSIERLDSGIAKILTELRVNVEITEKVYLKINDGLEKSDQISFLRFSANNSFNLSTLAIRSLLSIKKGGKRKEENEFSLFLLGEDEEIKEIRAQWKRSTLKNVSNNTVAHINYKHPNPAGNLRGYLDLNIVTELKNITNRLVLYFEKEYKWDLSVSSEGGFILNQLESYLSLLK